MDTNQVISLLLKSVTAAPSMATWARENGMSAAHVHDVLNGHRAPGPAILAALGLRKVVSYVRDRADG